MAAKCVKYCLHLLCISFILGQCVIVQSEDTSTKNCTEGCLRKCCPQFEIFFETPRGSLKCSTPREISSFSGQTYFSENLWAPKISATIHDGGVALTNVHNASLTMIASHPKEAWCNNGPFRLDSKSDEGSKYLIKLLKSGAAAVKNHALHPWRLLAPGSFCVEGVLRKNENFSFVSYSENTLVIDCSEPAHTTRRQNGMKSEIYAVCHGVACFFLALTLVVYVCLWERQNIHSWTLMAYCLTCFVLYVSLFIRQAVMRRQGVQVYSSLCFAIGAWIHFLYLSMFCWLTLINFDVWRTFRVLEKPSRSSRKRFLGYFLFALMAPLVVVFCGVVMDFAYRDNLHTSVVFPDYGNSKCFVDMDSSAAFFYMFLPASLLMVANLCFFTMTIISLQKIKESTKMATSNSTAVKQGVAKPRFLLFTKLFFVMGVCLVLEIINYAIFGQHSNHPVSVVIDVLLILQPIAIFIIFVCKKDVVRGILMKFPGLRKIFIRLGIKYLPGNNRNGLSTVTQSTGTSTHFRCKHENVNCSQIHGTG